MTRRCGLISVGIVVALALAPLAQAVITVEGFWVDSSPGLGIVAGNQFRVTIDYELASYVGSQIGGLGQTQHAWTRGVDPGQEIEGDPLAQQGNTKYIALDVNTANPASPVYLRYTSTDANGDSIPDGAPSSPLRMDVSDENPNLGGDWFLMRDAIDFGALGGKDAIFMPLDWIFHQYFTDNAFELSPPTPSQLIGIMNTVKDDPQALVPTVPSNLAFALGGVTGGSQPGTGDVWGYVTTVVPEPATVTLLMAAGGLGTLIRRRRS